MSGLNAKDVLSTLKGFWILTFPVTLASAVVGGIKSTLSHENKEKMKTLQKKAVLSAMMLAKRNPGYKEWFGYELRASKKNGEENLKLFTLAILEQMINDGYEYDFLGFSNLQKRLRKFNKAAIIKNTKLYNFFRCKAHNKEFSLKKTISTLSGSCQELSVVISMLLASQSEKSGMGKITGKGKTQNLLTPEEQEFLTTLPTDRKFKIVFGDLIDNSRGITNSHVIVEIEFSNPVTNEHKTMVIDPATIFAGTSSASKKSLMRKYAWVTPTTYGINIMNDMNYSFVPESEIEIKNDTPIEKIYRHLFDTSRLYPHTEAYDFRERDK